MVDEIQTGLGRTGRWFGFQHLGVEPDVVTMAKALGNGMPVGACWARAEVAAAFVPGDHGSTFGGQPLAMSAARATLAVMEAEDVPARARVAGARLRAGLEAAPRGGLACGARACCWPPCSPASSPARPVGRRSTAGLVINAPRPDVLRFAPSLLVTRGRDRPGRGHPRAGCWPDGGGRASAGAIRRPAEVVEPDPARPVRRPGTSWTSTTSAPTAWPRCWPWPSRTRAELPPVLDGRGVALLFEKPSNRTRNSSEMAAVALGGHPVYIQGPRWDSTYAESAADVARTLACYHSVLCARVIDHASLVRMADALDAAGVAVPVVNLLSDRAHPCQAVADLLTLRQVFGADSLAGSHGGLRRRRQQRLAVAGHRLRRWPGCPPGCASPDGYGPSRRTMPTLVRSFGGRPRGDHRPG